MAAAGAFAADFEIRIDPKAKPIKDMRQTGCNSGMGFNAALEQVFCVANDDYWFVSNKVSSSAMLREAGANLLRLQCMRSWWNRRNDKKNPTNPKAAFDFYRENGIKVWVCLECWSTNDVPNCVEIVKWIVDNGYKGVVAGIEMGNESYGRARASRGARSAGRTRSPASPRGATGTRRSRSPGIAATRRFPRASSPSATT